MIGRDRKKALILVAALLVAAVPAKYAWEESRKRKERARAEAAAERVAAVMGETVQELEREQRQRDLMALLARHKAEMDRMTARHEQEKIADRISDNLRPGSAGHHGTEQWDEFQALLEKQEEEKEEFERTRLPR